MVTAPTTSFTLTLRQGRRVLGTVAASEHGLREEALCEHEADASRPINVSIKRPTGSGHRGQLRLGAEVIIVLPPGRSTMRAPFDTLRDEYGEATFIYEEADPDRPDDVRPILSLALRVAPAPGVKELYDQLVVELEGIHVGLAQDLVGKTRHRVRAGALPSLRTDEDVRRLRRIARELDDALGRIGARPSSERVLEMGRARWRPGDRIPRSALGSVLSEPETVVVDGRITRLGRVPLARRRQSLDIAEHRQIRAAVLRLASGSRSLARHFERAAREYAKEARRWGPRRESLFEKETRPRIRELEAGRAQALRMAERFDRLLVDHDFLHGAGEPRRPLGPTPLFLHRDGYRQAYRALQEAERFAAPFVAGEEVLAHYKSLSKLYEYWCFVKVVELLGEILGAPVSSEAFRLVDDVYRPDLLSGQSIRFRDVAAGDVVVTYEPDIPPEGPEDSLPVTPALRSFRARRRDELFDGADPGRRTQSRASAPMPYRAALSQAPLRPDITVERRPAGRPPTMLVLDAKSTASYDRRKLWEHTDYRTRIFDPVTGHQPVRQVFFLHRDVGTPILENLPGYVEGRSGSAESSLLGAVAFLPDRTEHVARVLRRFLGLELEASARD